MTNSAQPGDIDALVSSVRDLVAHEKPVGRRRRRTRSELLILTQACRVDDEDAPAEYISVEEGDSTPSEEPELASNVLRLNAAVQPERKTLEAKIAELEAAVTAQPEDWEPDEGEAFASDAWAASAFQTPAVDSPTPAHEPTQSRAEMVAQLAREVEEAIGIGQPKPAPSPEMDMQAMRAMVVQIIREELAGELGEKITRNVRKLVRREINRVLASHDLD
ncbi:hypothetical protein [Yoonia sp. BS5-3]|uniref:Uncharacterized protein n=1 Tax=Yoonia phaeophyticola TaxID=3137369 RepID=A0ABZ3IDG0_9RHOB